VSLSGPFILRPVATTLLTIAIALAGILGFHLLPVSPLPEVDFPTIQVSAGLPGASPETMAASVATPLERQFARIAGLTEMTSTSYLGSTSIVLQFDLSRQIDSAARDVQAAINAARGYLPANLPNNPTYRKVNPADAPILILALTSDIIDQARMYDVASSVLAQRLSQVSGVGQVAVGGSALPAVRVELNPTVVNKYGIGIEQIRKCACGSQRQPAQGRDHQWKRFISGEYHGPVVQGPGVYAPDRRVPAGCARAFIRSWAGHRFGGRPPESGPGGWQARSTADHLSSTGRKYY
jgi:multidrug efflux pump